MQKMIVVREIYWWLVDRNITRLYETMERFEINFPGWLVVGN